MRVIKEHLDSAVQTGNDSNMLISPLADPAVVLVVTTATRIPRIQATPAEASFEGHASILTPSFTQTDGAYNHSVPPESPTNLLSHLPKRKQALEGRYPGCGIANRRIISMPENEGETSVVRNNGPGMRVVSMPDRIRPVLGPSVELFGSPSEAAKDSFVSYSGRRERVRVFCAPSDVPQTPSPPSSPDSLLDSGPGVQFPGGFSRRTYSPEPLIGDQDWVTWTNSPPRPIPALHGPLSLPYARCPSGAEGTIIEESDNVSRMIWGLGPDDLPHNQPRPEGLSVGSDDPRRFPSHGPNHAPSRLQKKTHIEVEHFRSNTVGGYPLPTNGALLRIRLYLMLKPTMMRSLGFPGSKDSRYRTIWVVPTISRTVSIVPLVDDSRILEWQFALLRQALRDSAADIDPYPRGLEPVIPPASVHGFGSRTLVFSLSHGLTNRSAQEGDNPRELVQQYRQEHVYRQAPQNQKTQQQNFLPTPPNSSSPQWSSHFPLFGSFLDAVSERGWFYRPSELFCLAKRWIQCLYLAVSSTTFQSCHRF
ncbi:hypothetical protein BU15DRAFT_59141 [Melanogaster broomeanus]|nr:hypothetical protein BU15DRAFT_59141 [Melanogaster broomeanus]